MNMNKKVDYEKGIKKLWVLWKEIKDTKKKIQKSNSKEFLLGWIQLMEELLEGYELLRDRFDDKTELGEILDILTKAKINNYYDAIMFVIFELKISLKEARIRLEELKICGACGYKHKELVDICEKCGWEGDEYS